MYNLAPAVYHYQSTGFGSFFSNLFAAGEGDDRHIGVGDERVTNHTARTWEEVQNSMGEIYFCEDAVDHRTGDATQGGGFLG